MEGLKVKLLDFQRLVCRSNRKFYYCSMFSKRKTILKNCAIEPEIKDLSNFLNSAGAKYKMVGQNM